MYGKWTQAVKTANADNEIATILLSPGPLPDAGIIYSCECNWLCILNSLKFPTFLLCVYRCGHTHLPACVWGSENNLWEVIFSLHYVGPKGLNLGFQA